MLRTLERKYMKRLSTTSWPSRANLEKPFIYQCLCFNCSKEFYMKTCSVYNTLTNKQCTKVCSVGKLKALTNISKQCNNLKQQKCMVYADS